jgi:hypothetical protein
MTKGTATPILKVVLLLALTSFLSKTQAISSASFQFLWQQSPQVHFPVCLVRKLKLCRTLTSLVANLAHATATALHFPANAGLLFLTDEFTNVRYMVDTEATLSIVPCTYNAGPSGPLLKGADDQPIPSWVFVSKTV